MNKKRTARKARCLLVILLGLCKELQRKGCINQVFFLNNPPSNKNFLRRRPDGIPVLSPCIWVKDYFFVVIIVNFMLYNADSWPLPAPFSFFVFLLLRFFFFCCCCCCFLNSFLGLSVVIELAPSLLVLVLFYLIISYFGFNIS